MFKKLYLPVLRDVLNVCSLSDCACFVRNLCDYLGKLEDGASETQEGVRKWWQVLVSGSSLQEISLSQWSCHVLSQKGNVLRKYIAFFRHSHVFLSDKKNMVSLKWTTAAVTIGPDLTPFAYCPWVPVTCLYNCSNSSTLKMEAACCFEILESYKTTLWI
jgi:hypothetical protein